MKEIRTDVYSEELFQSLKGMTIKNIRKEMGGVDLHQAGVDYDDLEQHCRIWLWEACSQYRPDSGLKFSNFYWLKISSKLGNFRNKFQRASSKMKMKSFTSIGEQFWGVVGLEGGGEETAGHYGSRVEEAFLKNETNEVVDSIIEAKKITHLLKPVEQAIYNEFYILGRSLPEIVEEFKKCEDKKSLKYYQIRKIVKDLEGVHKTLIMGEVC